MFPGVSLNSKSIHKVSLSSILNIKKKTDDLKGVEFPHSAFSNSSIIEKERVKSEPSLEWEKVNEQYRKINEIDDIYSIAPELVDPKIPIKNSLELIETKTDSISNVILKTLKKPECGLSGKVKFVHFKNDPFEERWFAIKRPMSLFQNFFQNNNNNNDNNIQTAIKYYDNNLKMALKIGDHPNFMKVHGIVVKERSGKQAKPYLILEYIEGKNLRNIEYLSLEDKINVLSQLKDALMHLLELGILPIDTNMGNFLITEDKQLKIIDFDPWKEVSPCSEPLAQGLYAAFCSVVKKMGGVELNPNPLNFDLNIKQSFENAINDTIQSFSERIIFIENK